MSLLPSDAINRARKDTNYENTAFPTDDDLIRWISEGEQRFFSHMNDHVKRWNVFEHEFQRDSTTREYDLPQDYGGYFTYVEYFGNSGKPDSMHFIKRRRFNFSTGAQPRRFYVDRDRIIIDPQPDVTDSQNTIRMGYHRVPQRKHIGTAQNNASVEIQLATSPATGTYRNYESSYVNEKIRIVAGTGKGQEARLVSHDNTTAKASFASKLSTAISTDSKYETVIDVDQAADEDVIVDYAKMKLKQKDEQPDNVHRQSFRNKLKEAVNRRISKGYGRWRRR